MSGWGRLCCPLACQRGNLAEAAGRPQVRWGSGRGAYLHQVQAHPRCCAGARNGSCIARDLGQQGAKASATERQQLRYSQQHSPQLLVHMGARLKSPLARAHRQPVCSRQPRYSRWCGSPSSLSGCIALKTELEPPDSHSIQRAHTCGETSTTLRAECASLPPSSSLHRVTLAEPLPLPSLPPPAPPPPPSSVGPQ